jgi:hypothetical protein
MKDILIIFCFLAHCNIYSQHFGIVFPRTDLSSKNNNTIDSSNVRIWYALNATDINNEETYDDLQRLDIGSHISKYYSYFIYRNDSLVTDWLKKHLMANQILLLKILINANWIKLCGHSILNCIIILYLLILNILLKRKRLLFVK